MFPTRKRLFDLHLGGNAIRTTADHPLYVEGWINPGDVPGATSELQEIVHNLGELAMPLYPFVGFVAGTKIMTAKGPVNIEELKPGDMIQVQPMDRKQADELPAARDQQPQWWESN